jgi:nucleotide-binding universal stress UspA family protein
VSLSIKRILAAVDFSETSDKAFDYAMSLARVFEAEVVALHVVHDPIVYAPTTGQEWRDSFERIIEGKLEALLNRHTCEGVNVSTVIKQGGAWLEIIEYAKANDCDLIVLGTHGHGPVNHMLMGSVAEKVVRKAKHPVLVVRPDQHHFVMP